MENKTVYCGSGKKQTDTWFKATINADKIKAFIEEFNGNKFFRININVKDQPDRYGKDVSITIDQWKPDESKTNEISSNKKDSSDDLPF